jgi:small subunit ribosomal protein S15
MISTTKKQDIIKTASRSKTDTGSPEVQVSIMTARISEITDHLKENKHDFMARRGLLQLVGKRRRLLKYLAQTDPKSYLETVKRLGLRVSK